MADYTQMANALRAQRVNADAQRRQQASQGGAAVANPGMLGVSGMGGNSTTHSGFSASPYQDQGQTSQPSMANSAMDLAKTYNNVSRGGLNRMINGSAGDSSGALGTSYAGSGAPGTGYQLGGALTSGGATEGLGSSLGTYGGYQGAASAAPATFGTLGSTTAGGTGGLLAGEGAAGGATLGGSSAAAGGSTAGAGLMGSAGMLGGLAALGYLGDKEMNENKGSIINADKLNDAGSIGNSGIGFRMGDFANGFNPATWLSDPKKGANGLLNGFTLGFWDKIF